MVKRLVINSNDGWQFIEFNLIEEVFSDSSEVLIFNTIIISKYWDQSDLIGGHINTLIKDQEILFEQLCIEKKSWIHFIELIESWKAENTLFSCDLYNRFEEILQINLTTESDLISSSSKPTLEFYVKKSRLELKSIMIIDQTSFSYTNDDDLAN